MKQECVAHTWGEGGVVAHRLPGRAQKLRLADKDLRAAA